MKNKLVIGGVIAIVLYFILKRSGVLSTITDTIGGKVDDENEAIKVEKDLAEIASKYSDENDSSDPMSSLSEMGIDIKDGTVQVVEEVGYSGSSLMVSLGVNYPFRPCLKRDRFGNCAISGELMFIPRGQMVKVLSTLKNNKGAVLYAEVCYNGYKVPVKANLINKEDEVNFNGSKVVTSVFDAPDIVSKSVKLGKILSVIETKIPKDSYDYHRANKLIGKLLGYSKRLENKKDKGAELSATERQRVASYVVVRKANDIRILRDSTMPEESKKDGVLDSIGQVTRSLIETLDKGSKRVVSEQDHANSGYQSAVEDGSLYSSIERDIHNKVILSKNQTGYKKEETKAEIAVMMNYLPASRQAEMKNRYNG